MKDVKSYINNNFPEYEIIIADGLDDAFIGIGMSFNRAYACYDRKKVIKILIGQGMTKSESEEYFNFNIGGAYVGENTPVFIERVA